MEKQDTQNYINSERISNDEFELICEIIKIRINSGISQKELEKETGISQPNIARFERNTHTATLATTLKILNALGYTLKIEKQKR